MWLALTTCNRFEVLQLSIHSLLRSSFPEGTHLLISDDCSSDKKAVEFLKIMSSVKINNLTIETIFREKRLGCDSNMVETIKSCFIKSNDPFVVTIDSDAIYNPQWLNKLIEAKNTVTDKIGMLTIYDSNWHGSRGSYNDILNKKDDVGGFACMLNRDIFMSPEIKVTSWDWSYVNLCKKLNYLILSTKVSYAQHIGKSGEHSDGSSNWDHAENFVEF